MKKILLIFILVAVMLFVFPQKLSAQVVINEVNPSDEWIELFKTSSGAVPLEGCILYFHSLGSSTSNTQKRTLTVSDNFLESEEYKVINSGGNWLNNSSSDTVLLDCPSYDDGPYTYGDNLSPMSYTRVPNGTGSFVALSESTQGSANPDPTSETIPIPTFSPTTTPTSSPSPTQTSSKAVYKINKSKDNAGLELTSVQIYVDGQYIHHVDDEILEFYSGNECYLGVSCGFGNHTISLRKNGYSNWEETRDFLAGVSFEVSPVLDKQTTVSSTPSPSPSITPTKTSTPIPTKTPIPTPTNSPVEEILGAETIFPSQSPEGIQDTAPENTKNTFPFLAVGIIALGLGFMGFSVFSIIKSVKKSYNIESEKENSQIS